MGEEHWQQARLIPTSGISGADEQERRSASALMAVLTAVSEFGAAITKPLGAPSGPVEAFIEVPFKVLERDCRPDGLLRVVRGQKRWVCLVEIKTGANDLTKDQVEMYLDVAREQAFDAVLTISNQISPRPDVHPVDVDKRKVRKVVLHHLSWSQIVGEAIMQRIHRGVEDPDQAWILGELIRYLEHPKSGAHDFHDMGGSWTSVRDAIIAGTLRPADKRALDVAARWDQLLRYAAVRMSRELGVNVHVAFTRKELAEPETRTASLIDGLCSNGVLAGTIRIPNTVGPIEVVADVRAGRLTTSVEIDAPDDGRQTTRVSWLLRQLVEARPDTRLDASAKGARSTTSALLSQARVEPGVLVEDPKREIRGFTVSQSRPLGTKRGVGRGCFIDSVLSGTDDFYAEVVQRVRPWAAKAPKRAQSEDEALLAAGVDTTPDREGRAILAADDPAAAAAP